ncbi:MAG: hypothetical protein K8R88_08025 [Armatimonadetes bacterium]|nr:hypothetical protein [Armatimonadota bacterium]
MSFRVNTNISAMSALRSLGQNGSSMATAMARLSSGVRINSGADDPAGLQISEGFRSQITSMDQALRNNSDASNFAKTAEGALSEVNRLLNDARSLAIANSNDATLTVSQKQANQNQLTSILSSVDRISSNTSYGTKKLLDGSAGVQATITDSTKVQSFALGGTIGGTSITTGNTMTLNVTTAAVKATANGRNGGAVTVAAFGATAVGAGNAGSFSVNGTTFTTTAATTNAEMVNMVNAKSAETGVTMDIYMNGANATLRLTSNKFGTVGNAVNISSSSAAFSAVGSANLAGGVDAVATVDVLGGTPKNFTAVPGTDGLTLGDSDGNRIVLTALGGTTVASSTVGQVQANSSQFQIGANAGQTTTLSLSSSSASSLGLTGTSADIMSVANSATTLAAIDTAINTVSGQRGSIGNFMRNVIDSNTRALGVAKENLEASDSSIRDTDMAAEMTKYTQLQVLQQAGLSMLAQANSSSSAVLSLLRG